MSFSFPPAAGIPTTASLLSDLFQQVNRVDRRVAASVGLTPRLARTLLCVLERKPCCVNKLGILLSLPAPSMSRVLGRLEVLGLVTRPTDATDHRQEHVELTPAGLEKASLFRDLLNAMFMRADNAIPGRSVIQDVSDLVLLFGDLCSTMDDVVRKTQEMKKHDANNHGEANAQSAIT